MNIISVDWSNLDTRLLYDAAVNARQVAKVTANLIDEMYDMGTPLENIHVIGFSLGAQVSSFIQRNMKSGKLERITGICNVWVFFSFIYYNLHSKSYKHFGCYII